MENQEELQEAPSTATTTSEAAPQPTEQPGQVPPADLNVSDLAALKSIIEIASQRGAFKANEFEIVGKTFNKLNNFLEAVTKKES